MKKLSFLFLILIFMLPAPKAQAKTYNRNITLLTGGTRSIKTYCTEVKNLTVSNKNMKVKEKDSELVLTAKKTGTTTLSFYDLDYINFYRYQVTILSTKKVKKDAKKQFKKFLKQLPSGTKYAYVDFNNDGIEELIHNGSVTFYNYDKKKLVTKKYHFSEVYLSKKKPVVLAVYPDNKKRKTDYFTYHCEYYTLSPSNPFKLVATGTGYREYTEQGTRAYEATAPYAYYDYSYDQDDYDYEAMTLEQVTKAVKKKMPGIYQLQFITK